MARRRPRLSAARFDGARHARTSAASTLAGVPLKMASTPRPAKWSPRSRSPPPATGTPRRKSRRRHLYPGARPPCCADFDPKLEETLAGHLAADDTADALDDGTFDVVVLQQQSQIPASPELAAAQGFPAARGLAAKARRLGARPLLPQTWANRDGWPEAGKADGSHPTAGRDPTPDRCLGRGHVGLKPRNQRRAIVAMSSVNSLIISLVKVGRVSATAAR